jgi:predicted nucleotidyltransferase
MYLENYINEIKKLCKNNGVKYLYAFGSVLTNNFSQNSDIDLLVEITSTDPLVYAEQYFNLKFELENLLNRPIDLLEIKALKNPYLLENIDNSKTLIYAA